MPLCRGNLLLCSNVLLSLMAPFPLQGALQSLRKTTQTHAGQDRRPLSSCLGSFILFLLAADPGLRELPGLRTVDQSLGEQSGGAVRPLLPESNQHRRGPTQRGCIREGLRMTGQHRDSVSLDPEPRAAAEFSVTRKQRQL